MMPGLRMGEQPREREGIHVRSEDEKRQFDVEESLTKYYFFNDYEFENGDFESRVRMPSVVFEKALNGTSGRKQFVKQFYASKKGSSSPQMRMKAALRILACGKSLDELFKTLIWGLQLCVPGYSRLSAKFCATFEMTEPELMLYCLN